MADKTIPFTEDQWWRVVNNLHVKIHNLQISEEFYPTIDNEERSEIAEAIDQFENMAYQLYNNYANQFHHNPRARACCPNPECKGIYAYFWSDWNYCPKCGTKLEKTGEFWLK